MRSYRSSGFFNASAACVHVDAAAPAAPVVETPITSEFTPGLTLALLRLRGSELSMAVHTKLMQSTARDTTGDYAGLRALSYARRKPDGFHRLTPRGHFRANALAKALAEQLGITIPTTTHTATTRKIYEPGVKARFNFW